MRDAVPGIGLRNTVLPLRVSEAVLGVNLKLSITAYLVVVRLAVPGMIAIACSTLGARPVSTSAVGDAVLRVVFRLGANLEVVRLP